MPQRGQSVMDRKTASILDRIESEAALREGEEYLRQALNAANAGIWKLFPATGQFLASDRALELHGLPPGAAMNHEQALACVHPHDRTMVEAALRRALETGEPFRLELRAQQPEGSVRWLASFGECRGEGDQRRLIGLVQDITERKHAEEALWEREERLRFITDRARVGHWHWDIATGRVEWSPLCKEFFGIPANEPVSYARFLTALHPEDREGADSAVNACLNGGGQRHYDMEYRAVWPDGTVRWLHAKGCALFEDGKPLRMAGIAMDITERKAAEAALRESKEQWQAVAAELRKETERRARLECELSQVLRSTVEDQEAERQRIARELHDSLGQTLTILKLGLDEFGRALPDGGKVKEQLADLKALADEVGSEVNRLAWEIRPNALDDLGLEIAIRHLVETWSERLNLRFELRLALNGRRLNPQVETTLYRVLQEAITNIARHANASRVAVLLEASEKEVSMIVEDNGRGFSAEETAPAGAPSKHLGLLGIRERLSLVSGGLEVESAPDRGCTLYIRAPL
jgi:PAS domain S-box-containing protein